MPKDSLAQLRAGAYLAAATYVDFVAMKRKLTAKIMLQNT